MFELLFRRKKFVPTATKYPTIIPAKFKIKSSTSKLRPTTGWITSTTIGTITATFQILRLLIFSETKGRKKPNGTNIRKL